MAMIDLLFEFPDRTVLRVADGDNNVVTFIERHDEDADGEPERWFLPSGDREGWSQVVARLQAARTWAPVTPSLTVLDVLAALRADFHARLSESELAESGFERQRLVGIALAAEQAAQRLAMASGMPPVNWSLSAPQRQQPTEVIPAVEAVEPQQPADFAMTPAEVAELANYDLNLRQAWSQLVAALLAVLGLSSRQQKTPAGAE
ncbi:hypothetical protein [Micromonospora sp. NPDC047730]|uniref:hypothetical protein n=1 Tax=Micromonospora sp. NPDC047730 TaxID=3364253 RepID=UPI003715C27E